MFKSVFAKYVTTFMVLLLVSFMILLIIVSSVIGNHSRLAEWKNVHGVAASCTQHLSEMYAESDTEVFSQFIHEGIDADAPRGDYVRRLLDAVMTNFNDMTVYVTDTRGGFIFSTGKISEGLPTVGTPLLSEEELTRMERSPSSEEQTSDDGDLLPLPEITEPQHTAGGIIPLSPLVRGNGQNIAIALPVKDASGARVGTVIVTSTALAWSNMMVTALRSIAVAGLWTMLAALIAIYFTTERIISPLREISRASKKLMVGDFSVRVKAHGRDEVAELAVAFNQMADSLENLDRMRSTFVANISHDLRTPMTTISGFIDGILDGVIPPEEQEHYLRVVSDEVQRLSRLVTVLLDVSRLQAGDRKFHMQSFDICETGRMILISFEQKINEKGLDVEFDCDEDRMYVWADRDAIHQILYNICDNAVKFSSPGGKLRMRFAYTDVGHHHKKVTVSVYNEGVGIPPEDLPFIFERFYKSDKSRSMDKSGVGLGMFISKAIIEAHGESISVESEYEKNCTFTFTLTPTEPQLPKGV